MLLGPPTAPGAGGGPDPRLDPAPGPLVRAVARLAAWLWPLRGPPPRPAELRRVLVVRTDDRVGNALLTVPLVRALQRALPGARVDLLLAARRAPLVRGLPGLTVVGFDKRLAWARPWRFAAWLWRLRAARYDAAVDAAHWHAFSLTSALLARLAGHRAVVGHERGPRAPYSATVAPPPPGAGELAAKLSLLGALGLPPPAAPPALETSAGAGDDARAWAEAALAGALAADASAPASPSTGQPGARPRFAALNPGGRKADHRWPAARFGQLARALRDELGLVPLVTWGPGEEPLARAVLAAAGGAARLAPPSDLEQLAALCRGAALVVTNDTGPMHLAVACGAPVLALLLAADGVRWSHPGPRFAGVPVPRPAPGAAPDGDDGLARALAAARALVG